MDGSAVSSGVTFAWEKLSGLLAEGSAALCVQHWEEIALDHETVPLDIDWDQLLKEEQAKRYRVFVARRAGRLIGYLPLIFWYPSRYCSTLHIQDDTIYVVPGEKNRFAIWMQLLDRAIEDLPRGSKLYIRLRPQHGGARIGKILEKRYGVRLTELVYSTVLAEVNNG
jgi:hypothetical protein